MGPARPDEARLPARRSQRSRLPFKEAPANSERRAEALACEVKGEVTANGRRRRTFVRKGLRPAPRRMNPPHACLCPDSPRTDGPRRDRQGPGQMSPGAGRWPPLLLYFAQPPARPDEARLAVGKAANNLPSMRRRRTPNAGQIEPAARDAGTAQRPRPPCQCWCHAWNINTFHRCVCHLRSPRRNASQTPRTRATSKQP